MAAPAIAAVAKKAAQIILTNPKLLKKVLGIILGIILIILMPIIAVIAVLNGNVEIDTSRLQEHIEQQMTAEDIALLQSIENTMISIEDTMEDSGYSESRIKEAQVLYTLALYDYSSESDFAERLTGCFAEEQTDAELIVSINSEFGTDIKVEDFKNVMDTTRKNMIDTSDYVDSATKNNLDLVTWVIRAEENKWGYVYGTYGNILSKQLLNEKASQYPDDVGSQKEFIESTWLKKRTADCVGLIKGYAWFNPTDKSITVGTNGMPDISANTMYDEATEKGTIDTIPEIPGLAVWYDGHIGIYIGDSQVVQAAGTQSGVIKNDLSATAWTHWLKIPYITYHESA